MTKIKSIKLAQKESLLFREISKLFLPLVIDNPRLAGLTINRVELSPDKSSCSVYFYTPGGPEEFEKVLDVLKLYKPSLRAALAKTIKGRYTPDLTFKFDKQFEKEQRINLILNQIKDKGESS